MTPHNFEREAEDYLFRPLASGTAKLSPHLPPDQPLFFVDRQLFARTGHVTVNKTCSQMLADVLAAKSRKDVFMVVVEEDVAAGRERARERK